MASRYTYAGIGGDGVLVVVVGGGGGGEFGQFFPFGRSVAVNCWCIWIYVVTVSLQKVLHNDNNMIYYIVTPHMIETGV